MAAKINVLSLRLVVIKLFLDVNAREDKSLGNVNCSKSVSSLRDDREG